MRRRSQSICKPSQPSSRPGWIRSEERAVWQAKQKAIASLKRFLHRSSSFVSLSVTALSGPLRTVSFYSPEGGAVDMPFAATIKRFKLLLRDAFPTFQKAERQMDACPLKGCTGHLVSNQL